MPTKELVEIQPDRPLNKESALDSDKFGRRGFASAAAASLANVCSTAGLVVSVEGSWGSGKTSALAMIEAMLLKQKNVPVIVHFNPWLIGSRDALLRGFLARIAAEVAVKPHSENGLVLAKALNTYSSAFDLLKLIPGAEPLSSIVQAVFSATGKTVEAISELKAPDVEAQKEKVEAALRNFLRPIIVVIDDIDRLFPEEVYEIVRIVKAVGDLPNVGYILAWDPEYVSEALAKAGVPRAASYLDKIVQLRLPLPTLSRHARESLINEALNRLPEAAMAPLFRESEERLSTVYRYGLCDLLEQPRDFYRIFNIVAALEPSLRGEVVLGDIIGLAGLMAKAPQVYDLLCRNPRFFVGNLPYEAGNLHNEDVVKEGKQERNDAIARSTAPRAVRKLVEELFPLTSGHDSSQYGFSVDGCICVPERLLIALQLQVTGLEVSIANSRQFIDKPTLRQQIQRSLSPESCIDFLARLGQEPLPKQVNSLQITRLCLDIAAMVDQEPFVQRSSKRNGVIWTRAEDVAIEALLSIVSTSNHPTPSAIAEQIARSRETVSVGMELFIQSYLSHSIRVGKLELPEASRKFLEQQLSANVLEAAKSANLWRMCNVGRILMYLPQISATTCADVFREVARADDSIDNFVLCLFSHKFDSVKGLVFAPLSEDTTSDYCTSNQLLKIATKRLEDSKVDFPVRAAWLAIAENREAYACDGSKPH